MQQQLAQHIQPGPALPAQHRALLPPHVLSFRSCTRNTPVRRMHHASAQQRFFNIQIQASWGNGSDSSPGGDAAYGSQPRFGFLSSSGDSSSPGINSGGSGSSSGSSPIEDLLASIRAAPVPGAASPWVAVVLLPIVLWSMSWVFTTGMFTLAQTSMSGMCSVAKLLYPTIPLRGASYEDIAVSLVKSLQTGTDMASTWTRPGLWVPGWLLRWLMGTMFGLAATCTSLAGSLMNSPQLLVVSGASKGLVYGSCLLFMLPLGAGLNSLAATIMQQLQRFSQKPDAVISSSSSSFDCRLPSLSDSTALALKLSGLLAWPCISAAAVLQPALLTTATGPTTSHLAIAAPQVAVCTSMLALLLTVTVVAGRFMWELARQQADGDVVVDFGLEIGVLCGLQGVLNVCQLGLGLASKQMAMQQLAIPVLSTLILARVAWSTWRLWRIEANTPSTWLQVLTVTPGMSQTSSTSSSGDGGDSSRSSSRQWRA